MGDLWTLATTICAWDWRLQKDCSLDKTALWKLRACFPRVLNILMQRYAVVSLDPIYNADNIIFIQVCGLKVHVAPELKYKEFYCTSLFREELF